MIFVPEILIKKTIDIYLKMMKDDLVTNSATPNKSFLKKIVKDLSFGKYTFFDQGKVIFNKAVSDPRIIEVDYMYNAKVDRFPNIFIHLGSQTHSGTNAMSFGQGYESAEEYELVDDNGTPDNEDDDTYLHTDKYTRRMNGVINVVILSDNSNETILLYYILQAGLISFLPHLAMAGFENIKMNGQDLVMFDEVIPKNCFKRVIQLTFEYMTSSLDMKKNPVYKNIIFELEKIYEK